MSDPHLPSTRTRTCSTVQRCSVKKVFLKISQNPQENTFVRVHLPRACNFIKKRDPGAGASM